MALYQVVIQKSLGTEFWVNDYTVDASSADGARVKGLQIADLEKVIHHNDVLFTSMRVRLNINLGEQGTVYTLSFHGTGGDYGYAPLFNVARIDMSPTLGRPGRKYLRLPCPTASIVGGRWAQSSLDSINDAYCIPLQNLGGIVKPNGQVITVIRMNSVVGMRQLRRGSKRRLEPIIPVA